MYLKCEVVGVAEMDALLDSFDSDDRDHWAEGLLPRNSHIRSHIVNQKWINQVVFPLPLLHMISVRFSASIGARMEDSWTLGKTMVLGSGDLVRG